MKIKTVVFVVLWGLTLALVPKTINYQGKLTDRRGLGVNDTVPIHFALYPDSSSETALWEEVHDSVIVFRGMFNVHLGAVNPFSDSLNFDTPYWLELMVDGEVMSPRKKLVAVPYSIRSLYADSTIGDNWGEQTVATSARISGDGTTSSPLDIAQQEASAGQVLKWDGTSWSPEDDQTEDGDIDPGNELQVITAGDGLSGGGSGDTINLMVDVGVGLGFSSGQLINTGDANGDDDLTTSISFGGDVSGTYDNLALGNGVVNNAEIADNTQFVDVQTDGAHRFYITDGSRAFNLTGYVNYPGGNTIEITGDGTGGGVVNNVVAGNGLSGGGSSATVTLHIGDGTGYSLNSDNLSLNLGSGLGFSGDNIVNTGDLSTSNELQNISSSGTGLSSSGSGTMNLQVSLNSGNSSGQIPVSNGSRCSNLNADMIDGHHYSSNWASDASTTNELQNLSEVLSRGNSAGSYDIQMNNRNIYSVDYISVDRLYANTGNHNALNVRNNSSSYPTIWAMANDNTNTIYAENNTSGYPTIYARNNGSSNCLVARNNSNNYPAIWAKQDGGSSAYAINASRTDGSWSNDWGIFSWNNIYAYNIYTNSSKSFVHPHPEDTTKDIVYSCLEGPEAATFIRGKGKLIDGEATVEFPDHFAMVTADEGLSVTLTPGSAESKGLAATKLTNDRLVVKELNGGDGDYDFYYFVTGIREGFEDYQVVRDKLPTPPVMEEQPLYNDNLPNPEE